MRTAVRVLPSHLLVMKGLVAMLRTNSGRLLIRRRTWLPATRSGNVASRFLNNRTLRCIASHSDKCKQLTLNYPPQWAQYHTGWLRSFFQTIRRSPVWRDGDICRRGDDANDHLDDKTG